MHILPLLFFNCFLEVVSQAQNHWTKPHERVWSPVTLHLPQFFHSTSQNCCDCLLSFSLLMCEEACYSAFCPQLGVNVKFCFLKLIGKMFPNQIMVCVSLSADQLRLFSIFLIIMVSFLLENTEEYFLDFRTGFSYND